MLTESCETKIEILLHQNEILGPFLVKKTLSKKADSEFCDHAAFESTW